MRGSGFKKRSSICSAATAAAVALMKVSAAHAADQWLTTGTPGSGSAADISNINNYSPTPANLTDGTQDLLFTTEATAPSTLVNSINVDGLQFGLSTATPALSNAWNYTGGTPSITVGASGVADYSQKAVSFPGPITLWLSQTWTNVDNQGTSNVITAAGVVTVANNVTLNKTGEGTVEWTNTGDTFGTGSGITLNNGCLDLKSIYAGLTPGSISITGSDTINTNGTFNPVNELMLALGSTTSDTAINNTFLKDIAATTNIFTIGIAAPSANALDFSGSNGGVSLPGAVLGGFNTSPTYSGSITPSGNTYRFGGSVNGNITITSSLTGANNVTIFSGGTTTLNNSANNFTGVFTLNGNVTASNAGSLGLASAFNMGQGQLTISSGSLTTSSPVTFIGSTNGFSVNGNSLTLNGAVTETGTTGNVGFSGFNSNTNILTFGGTADNAGLAVNFSGNNGVVYLNKASGSSVHAIDVGLNLEGGGGAAPGQICRLTGTGSNQFNNNAFLEMGQYTTFDLNGQNASLDALYSQNNGSYYGLASYVTSSAAGTPNLTLGADNGVSDNSGNTIPVYNGIIQNGTATSLSVTKIGTGTQSFGNYETYTGATNVANGTLNVDYNQVANVQGNPSNLLPAGTPLVLSGGTFKVTGRADGTAVSNSSSDAITYTSGSKSVNFGSTPASLGLQVGQTITSADVPANDYFQYFNGNQAYLAVAATSATAAATSIAAQSFATSQTVNSVTISSGNSAIVVNSNGSSTGGTTLALTTLARDTGATVDFTPPAVGSITTTTPNANFTGGQQTILGGWATEGGGTTWAVSGTGATAGAITGLSTYDTNFDPGTDVEAGANTFNTTPSAINSLRFNNNGSAAVNLSGNLNVATGGILETTNVGNNPVTISNNKITSGNGQDLIVIQNNNASSMTISSAIVNPAVGSVGFTKSGAGNLVLTGSNTYTGQTTINAGSVAVNSGGTLGNGSSAVILHNTGSLVLGVSTQTQIPLTSQAGTAMAFSVEANPNPAADVSPSNAFDGDLTTRWSSAYSDPQWIEINLGQAYPIAAVDIAWETATGKNFVFQVSNSPGSFANGPTGTTSGGWTTVGTFTNQNPASTSSVSGSGGPVTAYTLSGLTGQYLAFYGTARNTGYGYSMWEMQAYEMGGGAAQNYSIGSLASTDSTTSVVLNPSANLVVGSAGTSTSFAGVISGYGSLTQVGTGGLTLSNVNTFYGNTNISGGTITVGNALALENSTVVLSGGTLNLNGLNATLGGLGGSGNLAIPASGTLAVGNNNFAASYSGSLSGTNSALVKIGGGNQILSAASTYTGGTNISAGALVVTNTIGSATGTGAVTVGVNGILGGNGIITGVVTAAGTVQPGVANPSVANVLTIGAGSTLAGTTVMDLTAANLSDEILFGTGGSGPANLGGVLTVDNDNSLATGQSYDLFKFNASSGTFGGGVNLPTLPNGLSWVTTNLYSTGVISITGTAAGAANLTWNNNASGGGDGSTWDTNQANWNNGTGTAAVYSDSSNNPTGDNVTFNDTNNSNYQVNITGTVHPTSVTFNNGGGSYNVSGAGGIAGPTSVVKYGTGSVTISTANTYTGGTFVNAGTLVLANAGAFPGGTNLSIGSTASPASVVFSAHNSGATANVLQANSLSLAGGTGAWTGQLDLTNNAMVIHSGSLNTVFNQLQQGYNNGNWNGTGGIVSSAAANDPTHLTALGVIVNDNGSGQPLYGPGGTINTTIDGASPVDGDILVKYTYYGDADLNGVVDGSDYSRIDNGALNNLTGWSNGDFNYDGVINGSDYTLIDNSYNTQGASLAAQITSPTAQIAGTSAVPEPATLGLLGIGAIGVLGRRRRRM